MAIMSSIRRDFVATNLRSQLNRLCSILTDIEKEDTVDCDYTNESLRAIEINLRQIRRLCTDT